MKCSDIVTIRMDMSVGTYVIVTSVLSTMPCVIGPVIGHPLTKSVDDRRYDDGELHIKDYLLDVK